MKLLKRFLVCFVTAFTLLFTITSCNLVSNGPKAEDAAKRIVLVQDKQTVSDDFQVPTVVVLEGVTFNVTWVSDNSVATIVDLDENYKKVIIDYKNNKDAEQTVVLTATVSNGKDSFDKRFTFKVPQYEETGLLKDSIRTPEFGVEYLLGLPQTAKNEVYYFTGAMSGYYGATETNSNLGIIVKLVETTGGFYVTFEVGGKTNYINGVKSGSYLNFVFSETPSNVWTWNQEHCTAVTTIEGTEVFMGTSDNYVTFGMMKVEELGKSTVYAGTLYKKPADYDHGNDDAPTTPTLVKNPEVNVEYLLGLDQTVKSAQYFFTGSMSGYYGATETDFGKGIAVKLVETTGGYYITFQSGGKTQYINGVKSGTHLNFVFSDTASNVWKWNKEHSTFTTNIEDKEVFMGTNDGYVTFGMLTTDKLGKDKVYPGHLYTKPAASSQGGSSNVQIDTNKVYTVAELLALGAKLKDGEVTTVRAKVKATIVSIDKPDYGQMTIQDETGTISVYGSYSADGTIGYSKMTEKPYANYEVVLSCILKNFKGTVEINSGWILEFEELAANFDEADYTAMTIEEARDAAVNSKVKVTGVVAKITYAFGMVPAGFYLVDETNSIYVYDNQIAPRVKVGDKITICASRANWILDTEATNASKFGYTGCIQVDKAHLIGEIESNQSVDLSWVTESTVKEIMDTKPSTNITTTIYKVNAYVKKVVGTGFTNYYIDDIDDVTGSYVYTQCSGSDFEWLDEFDGKICTVYLSAINAKSTKSACVWRFMPIAVEDNNYKFDLSKAAEYALTYHAVDQFLAKYTGNPQRELISTVSNAKLGIENVQISYVSDNTNIVYFETVEGKTILCANELGTAKVTITATYGNVTATKTVSIQIVENPANSALTVKQAIATEIGDEVTVKGIVGPSLVNKVGFYLMDNESLIAIETTEDQMLDLEIGNFVVVKGTRYKNKKDATSTTGQTCINNAEIIANEYGKNELPTSYIQEVDGKDFYDLDINEDHTTELYKFKGTLAINENKHYTNVKLTAEDGTAVQLYMSSAAQYKWLTDAVGTDMVTLVIAPCNWNSKNYYAGCILYAIKADGTVVYNTLNFSN